MLLAPDNSASLKRTLAIAHDLTAVALCWLAAFFLRFNLDFPEPYLTSAWVTVGGVVCIHAPVFWLFGLYRGLWRYASLMDLRRIIMAVGLSAALVTTAVVMLSWSAIPRSVLILHPLLLLVLMGGSRFVYRATKDKVLYGRLMLEGAPVLVLGAGDMAERLIRELAHSAEWSVVGLLTAQPSRVGRELRGVKVLGRLEEVAVWAERLSVFHAIVAMPDASVTERRRTMELAVQAGLSVLTVPALEDMLNGRVSISQIRQVQLEDLLGREPVRLECDRLHQWLDGQAVLVTGAGGSIGSELVRQLSSFGPRQLVLLDVSEYALYRIEQEVLHRYSGMAIVSIVGDVKDPVTINRVLSRYKPLVVFHAAAYKHVPLMEGENAWQAVQNNVVGSRVLAEAAKRHGVAKLVLISTDKAVNPTNVMGATKRLAERLLLSMQDEQGTRFVIVRFGNVLGSNGSVIPTFREQIARGGPVTVTHPEIIRYFMLIPEAAQLVMQAGLMGQGGELFVLDMGEPIRIVDLARDMIRLSGYSEDEIPVRFIGLRPGEKLYEEPLADTEKTLPTPHEKLRIARADAAPDAGWINELGHWLSGAAPESPDQLKAELQRFVPEYTPELDKGDKPCTSS